MNHSKDYLIDDRPELLERLKDIQVIYTDLDGTLFGHGGTLLVDGYGHPSTRAADALVEIAKAGIEVVPVTGRSDFQMIEVVRLCGLQHFIAESGAIVSWWTGADRKEEYVLPTWDEEMLGGRSPFEVMKDLGVDQMLFEAFAGQLEHHDPWHEPRKVTDVLRGRIDLARAQELLDTLPLPFEISENGAINPKRHTLDAPAEGCDGQIHAYHTVPAGVSKAAGIAVDLKRRGLAREQALMIGDSLSDLECAPSVAVALMVDNARRSRSVVDAIDIFDNVAFVKGRMGDGWVDMARLVLEAHP